MLVYDDRRRTCTPQKRGGSADVMESTRDVTEFIERPTGPRTGGARTGVSSLYASVTPPDLPVLEQDRRR